MSNPKVILLQGQFKFSPKLTNQQVNDNKKYHHYTNFILNVDTITCNSFLKMFQNENIAFGDVNYIIRRFRGKKFKYHGEILGLLEDNNKFKKVKFFIKNGKINHENCEFRLVKQGKPRGPYNKNQQPPAPPAPPAPAPPRVEKKDSFTQTEKSISSQKQRVQKADASTQTGTEPKPKPKPEPEPRPIKHITKIAPKSFRTLDDDKMLDDAVISSYVNIHLNKQKDNRKIAFESNYILNLLQQNRYNEILLWKDFRDKGLEYYDYIMFPLKRGSQDKGGHWILCIIDMKNDKIKIYDSLQSGSTYTDFINLIKEFLQNSNITRNFSTVYLKGPKQETGTDCGVFVSEYAKRFILNEPIDFKQSDIPQIRNNMKNIVKPLLKASIRSRSPSPNPVNNRLDIFEIIDYNSLEPGQQIDATVMDAYLELLSTQGNINNSNGTFLIMPSDFFAVIYNLDSAKNKAETLTTLRNIPILKGKTFKIFDNVYVPCNIENHWSILNIMMKQNTIQVLDSRNDGCQDEVDTIHKFLHFFKWLPKGKNLTEEYVDCPEQPQNNEWDCGIFCLEMLRCTFHEGLNKDGKPIFDIHCIPDIRRRMIKELKNKKLVKNYKYIFDEKYN